MFSLLEPSDETVRDLIARQQDVPFTYERVGATRTTPPQDFTVDHNRIEIGRGEKAFKTGINAIRNWKQFDLGWVSIVPVGVKLEVGATVAVKVRVLGTWSLNAARVIYLIEEPRRFGFAYGTLPDHVESGEERFSVEWLADDSVWFDILAFSRPRHPLVKIYVPLARMLQKRFARNSKRRMLEEVRNSQ
ncbi:MAG TPA: DUF1990 domain-containing protein [Pyrinomonadaceae bacterium]|nr:DUF1990 domain-containing protein [Pyrinomonadaceae bacterium]